MLFLLIVNCVHFFIVLLSLDVHAEEAALARMSYTAYVRAMEARLKAASKLTVRQIIKVAVICSFIVSMQYCWCRVLWSVQLDCASCESEASGRMFTVVSALLGYLDIMRAARCCYEACHCEMCMCVSNSHKLQGFLEQPRLKLKTFLMIMDCLHVYIFLYLHISVYIFI